METTKLSPPWAADSSFRMIDVSGKAITRRRAVARGKILLAPAAFLAVKNGTNPKGNVLALAEVAGIMAAKRTADSLPLCHPLPLQSVRVFFELLEKENGVLVRCEAITAAQTGVEMEALTGVSGALLAIYDLSKAVDPVISLGEIRLEFKEGGKSGIWRHPEHPATAEEISAPETAPLPGISVAVLTVSDRAFRGESEDRSGPAIRAVLESWGAKICASAVVPDEKDQIQGALRRIARESGASLIVTTGGTGMSPRDITPEAITEIADRLIPGIGECLRQSGAQHIGTAWLSRSLGALLGKTWIVALPGSERAVREGLDALRPLLAHGLHIAHGGNHPS